jgi:hypothetical protein
LYTELEQKVADIGVTKTRFHGAGADLEVRRGSSRSPLFVTTTGIDVMHAAAHVQGEAPAPQVSPSTHPLTPSSTDEILQLESGHHTNTTAGAVVATSILPMFAAMPRHWDKVTSDSTAVTPAMKMMRNISDDHPPEGPQNASAARQSRCQGLEGPQTPPEKPRFAYAHFWKSWKWLSHHNLAFELKHWHILLFGRFLRLLGASWGCFYLLGEFWLYRRRNSSPVPPAASRTRQAGSGTGAKLPGADSEAPSIKHSPTPHGGDFFCANCKVAGPTGSGRGRTEYRTPYSAPLCPKCGGLSAGRLVPTR